MIAGDIIIHNIDDIANINGTGIGSLGTGVRNTSAVVSHGIKQNKATANFIFVSPQHV